MEEAHNQNPPRNGEGVGWRRVAPSDPKGGGGGQPLVLTAPIKHIKRARKLRKEMSLPEVLLWQALRQRPGGFKFRRQHPQPPYAIDFACLECRLAIEIDGEAHNRGNMPKHDSVRDKRLADRGFRTLRIPATTILQDLDAALTAIVTACREAGPLHQPSAGPPPRAGEEQELS